MKNESCLCCGYITSKLNCCEYHKNNCALCFWVNDNLQLQHPDSYIKNIVTLREAQKNFSIYGAIYENAIYYVKNTKKYQ